MKNFRLSEKAKDRFLNLALVGSLLLLAGVFLPNPQVRREADVEGTHYSANVLQPLSTAEFPTFEAVEVLPEPLSSQKEETLDATTLQPAPSVVVSPPASAQASQNQPHSSSTSQYSQYKKRTLVNTLEKLLRF